MSKDTQRKIEEKEEEQVFPRKGEEAIAARRKGGIQEEDVNTRKKGVKAWWAAAGISMRGGASPLRTEDRRGVGCR